MLQGAARPSAPPCAVAPARVSAVTVEDGPATRGALRAGEDDARLGAGARAAASPATAARACRCPAAAPSAPAPSTSTSRASRRWAPRSTIEDGYVEARANGSRARTVTFDLITVTGTENVHDGRRARRRAAPCSRTPRASRRSRSWPGCSTRWARASAAPAPTHHHRGRGRAQAGRPRHHPGPHRGRHAAGRRRHHRRRRAGHATRLPSTSSAVISKLREAGVALEPWTATACAAWARERPAAGRHHDQPAPGLPHRHAGPADGAARCWPTAQSSSPRTSSRTASCTWPSCAGWARTSRVEGTTAVVQGRRASRARR